MSQKNVEMLHPKAGRIVVRAKDVKQRQDEGWIIIEETDLPLSNQPKTQSGGGRKKLEDAPDENKGDADSGDANSDEENTTPDGDNDDNSDDDSDEEKTTEDKVAVVKSIRSEEKLIAFMKENNIDLKFEGEPKFKEKKELLLEHLGQANEE